MSIFLKNQVVHCDLKAANILATKTGSVKLTDFGVSLNLKLKQVDNGEPVGTPNWSKWSLDTRWLTELFLMIK